MKQAKGRPQPLTLNRHLGLRLRAIRESRAVRQDDIAIAARGWGMEWSQSTVASIESGRREVSISELTLLTRILEVELAEIFGAGPVRLTRLVEVDGSTLAAIFSGRASEARISLGGEFVPMDKDPVVAQNVAISNLLWPGYDRKDHRTPESRAAVQILTDAHVDALSDAERTVARRLRTFPLAVAATARKLWGQSFTEERDKRVATEAPNVATPRTLQALRGHVTRRMIEDLEKEGIAGLKPARIGRKKGAPNAR